jgi:hypothetical protein
MSKFGLSLALLCVVLFMGMVIGSATVAPPSGCAVTRYAVPGDTFNLAGPTAPSGVVYTYLWTVVDASGNTMTSVLNPTTQNAQFMIPTTSPSSSYTATLSVGSGTSSGTITGCVLTSCLLINVQLTNTCGISGASSVCQTDATEVYTYTGNAAIAAGSNPTTYLNWIVDTTSVATHDATGKCTVDWTKFWSTSGTGAQTHNVIAEVHSIKSNAVLSTCTPYPVKVLPSPVTTITPT